jgi:uncharacterized protein (TIGR02453 family)
MLQLTTLNFLQELALHNERDWFLVHKEAYELAKADFTQLVGELIQEIGKFQDLGNLDVRNSVKRIYRDVRFSKNKKPYKDHLSAGMGIKGEIDYYLHIQPGNQSFLGGGMWAPTAAQLAKYRQEIDYNAAELKQIIEARSFRDYFPHAEGEVLKTTPKGYAKDHPEIELLKRKELFFLHRYTDKEVMDQAFKENILKGVQILKPYCDYMNYILNDSNEG